MSSVVDSRVVEMEFDNADFERRVGKSMNTLDNLNKKLDMSENIDSFDELGRTVDRMDFTPLYYAADQIGSKFSAGAILAYNALSRISNKVIDITENLVRQMSFIEQFGAGWKKYADKTEAVQTIMSATAQTWEESAKALEFEGTQMEFVSEQLDKLNWFSDETSYSFTDMTSNIGKFTSNGIKLEKAVTAMEGISVWAAKSGANVGEASRAMYNLSQAISVGAVKLQDWKSIENANMATTEFKQTAIETAAALGTLKKAGDGIYRTTSGTQVTITNFNNTLQDGWFTADVLMTTLDKYGNVATRLSQICEEYDLTATQFLSGMDKYTNGTADITDIARDFGMSVGDLLPLFTELTSEENALSLAAFRAAQEAKTFQEAIEATKDAVSTGWMKTFELIFGNYEEAKVVWTELANRLWDVFASGVDSLNSFLEEWRHLTDIIGGGREDIINSFWAIWDAVGAVVGAIGQAFRDIFPEKTWVDLRMLVLGFKSFAESLMPSEKTLEQITRIFRGLFAVVNIVKNAFSGLFEIVSQVFSHFSVYSGDILELVARFGDWLVELNNSITEMGLFSKIAQKVASVINLVGDIILSVFSNISANIANTFNTVIYWISEIFNRTQIIADYWASGGGITGIFDVLYKRIGNFIQMIIETFGALIGIDVSAFEQNVMSNFEKVGDVLRGFIEIITNNFGSIFVTVITGAANAINTLLEGVTGSMTSFASSADNVADGIVNVFKSVSESTLFTFLDQVFMGMATLLQTIWDGLVSIGSAFVDFGSDIGLGLSDMMKDKSAIEILSELFDLIHDIVTMIVELKVADAFASLGESVANITGIFGNVEDAIESFTSGVKGSANTFLRTAMAIGILAVALTMIADLDADQITIGLTTIFGMLGELMIGLAGFVTIFAATHNDFIKLSVALIGISVAIGILSLALKTISAISWDKALTSLGVVMALLLELGTIAKMLSLESGTLAKGGGSLIIMAVALNILALAVKYLANVDPMGLIRGLSAVLILMYMMANIFNANKFGGSQITAAAGGMMALGIALNLFALAIKTIGNMNLVDMAEGLGAILIAMYMMANIFNSNKFGGSQITAAAGGMMALGAGLLILSFAMKNIGDMSWEAILKGLSSIFLMMYMLSNLFNATKFGGSQITAAAGGMIALGIAMNLLAMSMKSFGKMEWMEILKSVSTVSLLMYMMTKMSTFVNPAGIMALGGAMLILGLALTAMVPPLLILGAIPLDNLIKSLGTIAAIMLMLGVAGNAVAAFIPGLAAITLAVMGLSLAIAMLGIGITTLAAGLTALSALSSVAIVAALASFEVFLTGLIDLIPLIVTVVINAVTGIITSLANVAPTLFDAFAKIFGGLLDMIVTMAPKIANTVKTVALEILGILIELLPKLFELVGTFLSGVLVLLIETMPQFMEFIGLLFTEILELLDKVIPDLVNTVADILESILNTIIAFIPVAVEAFVGMITAFIEAVADEIPNIVQAGIDLVNALLQGIASMMVGIVDAGFNMIISFINGITECLYTRGPELQEAILGLFIAIVENIWELLWGLVTDIFGLGKEIVVQLAKGIWEKITDVIEAIWGVIQSILDAIGDFMVDVFNKGKALVTNIITGMGAKIKDIKDKAGELINAMLDKIGEYWDDMVAMGKYLWDGFCEGMQRILGIGGLKDTVAGMCDEIIATMGAELEIHSPSRKAYALGEFFTQGFINAISDTSKYVAYSVSDMSQQAIDVMENVISNIAAMLDDDVDFNPVITPVIDMTNVEDGVKGIDTLISKSKALDVSASVRARTDSLNAQVQNGDNAKSDNEGNYSFVQNIYSPKAVSRIDIYRQTKNQFAMLKGMVNGS